MVFRNLHAGPKETHVFHLHAHQWVLDASDPNSTYLDSQTISPGATFSYGIEFGGSGNRNFTPGDSIFHCHLYPHFAQGMWELWRVHDAFESGLQAGQWDAKRPVSAANTPQSRSLPDAEVEAGIATPAIVPLPGRALAPMPSAAFRGYPFYIPGEPGHRPPQPALDMDVTTAGYDNAAAYAAEPAAADIVNGGLPRHVIRGDRTSTIKSLGKLDPGEAEYGRVLYSAIGKGGEAAQVIAQKVYSDFPLAFQALAADWDALHIKPLAHSGEPSERRAMAFHEGTLAQKELSLADGRLDPVAVADQPRPAWWTHSNGYLTSFTPTVAGMAPVPVGELPLFHVNGRGRAPGSPYANPCPKDAPRRHYRSAFIQTEITVNKHGWFDPQGRIAILEDDIKDVIDANTRTRMPEPLFFRANSGDCIDFKTSNFIPSALNADDFQIYTPTDTIGQHIHLVKFDVTSSDGSGNGWNYEDATFSPDEVRERIVAHNRTHPEAQLALKTHPLFLPGGSIAEAAKPGTNKAFTSLLERGQCQPKNAGESDDDYLRRLGRDHPYCGAQRTTQRWWADPILARNPTTGIAKDNTLRTVFTHDHMGPSSHQQHGLYAALVIEPANSVWRANPFDRDGGFAALEKACAKGAFRGAAAGAEPGPGDALADIDDAIRAAFAVRAAQNTDLKKSAEDCLKVALLGGSDLSKAPVALSGPGDKQLELIRPRPVFENRGDGGPTSTRATIVAPACLGDSNSSPYFAGTVPVCATGNDARQTRREFALAFADFAGVYNVALEPINPETPRDVGMRRFGERQVATRASRPIAISSEDPGTQLVNFRHEPLALRIADVTWSPALGGFDYRQTARRLSGNCVLGDLDCLGDMANSFSTYLHSERDFALATTKYREWVSVPDGVAPPASAFDLASPRLKGLTSTHKPTEWPQRLARLMDQVEAWRQDFNCSLYAPEQTTVNATTTSFLAAAAAASAAPGAAPVPSPFPSSATAATAATAPGPDVSAAGERFNALCAGRRVHRAEPWRVFGDPATPILAANEGDPVQIRLIQGSQEAQHIFTMNGLKWNRLPDSPNSGYVNAQPIGISEHFEFDVRVPTYDVPHADYLYFGSSVDQLWDGMWGVLRAYQSEKNARGLPPRLASGEHVLAQPARWLPNVPGAQASTRREGQSNEVAVCTQGRDQTQAVEVASFDVSAVRACDLSNTCGQTQQRGVSYSDRYGITDPLAVVYVLNREASCTRTADKLHPSGCAVPDINGGPTNAEVLLARRAEFAKGRQVEPLVLRAAAGQCITVKLRNHLPQVVPVAALTEPVAEKDAHFNFLPMIADGFNLNQFQMSHSVGISAPRISQNPVTSDGSNTGLNSAVVAASKGAGAVHRQGSLVAPCSAADNASAKTTNQDCSLNLVWSATDLKRADSGRGGSVENVPVEFGALPLRSFGDAVKHSVHGLLGALVIGPPGSQVCSDAAGPYPGGASRTMCLTRGTDAGKRYGDHVLVMQDAVSAIQDGFPVSNLSGAEEPDDYGVKAINYKTEPLWARRGGSPDIEFGERNANFDYTTVFSSKKLGAECESGAPPNGTGALACDPETPVITARAGDSLRLHFVHSGGHTRQQGLSIGGHGFHPYPWSENSTVMDGGGHCWPKPGEPIPPGCLLWQGVFNGFGPMMGQTLSLRAGGSGGLSKDYLIRTQASFLLDGGLWGILRVVP